MIDRRAFLSGAAASRQKVRLIAGPFAGFSATVRQDDGSWIWLRLPSGWPARVAPEVCAGKGGGHSKSDHR